jgi:hypothetical protein
MHAVQAVFKLALETQLEHFFLLLLRHQHTVNSFQTGKTAKKWFEEEANLSITAPSEGWNNLGIIGPSSFICSLDTAKTPLGA